MPHIESSHISKDQALTDLIMSIALEEAALAHVLNAEGEKMQVAIHMPHVTFGELMELNTSVVKLLDSVTKLETSLVAKLEMAVDTHGH